MTTICNKFEVGDKVDFVNDYGVRFKGYTITGIYEYKQDGVLKDFWYYVEGSDAPWCPKPERNLRLIERK